ncbi:PepSY-like domain-containing protein [Gramella sp. AN32]|uniref:PepSY-like domain-containing protein n=1 Tax=Christiangramia antarctica TaxID=2058158 RepID=A0ABW5X4I2_9FLAO|nr:PepSY-like domain-containing protein [Gramella sp. AN32]MCM4157938.1 hypothetical protein [Gramella sp. AN32]
MKKAILGIALVLAAITTVAFTTENKDQVPQAVKDAFAKKFPTVQKVDWEKENDIEWEAEFKMNKVAYSANFLEDGIWQETEHEIKISDVPQNILSSLKTNFPGYEIEEAEMAETPEGKVYEFEMEKGKKEMEITIDSNGKVLNKELEEDEDKD